MINLIFFILCLVSGLLVFINYTIKVPVDFTPVFFFSILITRFYGIGYSLLFLVIGGVLPTLISGVVIDVNYFLVLIITVLINLVSLFFTTFNLIIVGIILTFIYSILDGVVNIFFGEDLMKEVISVVFNISVNTLYFSKFGLFLIGLM